jgi:hypothetical protein
LTIAISLFGKSPDYRNILYGMQQNKNRSKLGLIIDLATLAVHWLKIFNTVAAGSLTILLTSCTNLAAPKTLFVTFGASEENFKDDSEQIRTVLNEYTEAFQRLNPDTNVVWINYKANRILEQITKDSALNLGPDVVIAQQYLQINYWQKISLRHYPINNILTTFTAHKFNHLPKQTMNTHTLHGSCRHKLHALTTQQ